MLDFIVVASALKSDSVNHPNYIFTRSSTSHYLKIVWVDRAYLVVVGFF